MKTITLLLFCAVAAFAAPFVEDIGISTCTSSVCKLPDCYCSSSSPPISGNIPQFVVLSFDDSATQTVYNDLIQPLLLSRKNPDGCAVSGTFFVTHSYSDYTVVNQLYNHGFEIGSHSITKNFSMEYWRDASRDTLIEELQGQSQILTKFAHVPASDIIGARIPQLQTGYHSFEALNVAGFAYDSSWTALQLNPFFPYSLEYQSTQPCFTQYCQVISTPKLWELPIIDWINQNGTACNNLEGCVTFGDADTMFTWMKKNFAAIYSTKVPFSLRVNMSWFNRRPENADAFKKFLDYLSGLKDVFMVSNKQVLDWMKKPTAKFSSCQTIKPQPCTKRTCQLEFEDSYRYMTSCESTCPNKFPWLGNPYGQ